MNQSNLESWIEQVLNVGSGFLLSFIVWDWAVRPLIHADVLTIESTFMITLIFTIVSLIRGYVWRRLFDNQIHRRVHRWVMQFVNRTTIS